MSFPIEFVFLRPWWLLLLLLGPLLAFAITRRGSDSWATVCDPLLLRHLICSGNNTSVVFVRTVALTTWTLAVAALAGPAWDREKADLFENLEATVVVLDLSQSMNSTDLLPSRLERARYKSIELIESQNSRATGLVVFAGSAFKVVPVSDDFATSTHLLQSVQTSMMPVQGSRASLGIEQARQMLKGSGYRAGTVVLIADEVDSAAVNAARALRDDGYSLSVIGVGTESGAPVVTPGGEFLRDLGGNLITATVNYSELAQLASAGGGTFSTITQEVSGVVREGSRFAADATGIDESVITEQWKDRGPYLLIFLLPLAALLYRRGWLLAVTLFVVVPAQQSFAFEWSDLWQRPDQRAAASVKTQNYDDQVIQKFPEWNGIALYRSEEFNQAALEFAHSDDAVSRYNRGNALAKSGDYLEAIEQYEAALQSDPQFESARFNLDIVRRLLQQQEMSAPPTASESEDQAADQPIESKDTAPDDQAVSSNQADQPDGQDEGALSRRSGQQAMGSDRPEQDESLTERGESGEQIELQANLDDELDQVMEQWLRQIPDDPGGLLRRKFHYEYLIRDEPRPMIQPW
ncbi:MAG: VWA domain-containing protein [Acidiferrobacterales bacterium]|nr:VWA domain-containing protein [Acidiferrobacterales bacterium]